ncbi:MAG TPA: hypothetical protein VK176_09355, partial [Phycisphaerales bacterium]|nr:hypothetical protein [Phycisphaerales bacterium]
MSPGGDARRVGAAPSPLRSLSLKIVLHANWTGEFLHLWAEDAERATAERVARPARDAATEAAPDGAPARHAFCADPQALHATLASHIKGSTEAAGFTLRLPAAGGSPLPSVRLRLLLGQSRDST